MNRLLVILFFFSYSAVAQSTDFILLQKRNKTIETYYAGNHITFTTVTGAYIDADITQIKNDTIFLQQFIVQQVPTTLGVYMLDTTNSYRYQYKYSEIKSIDNITGRHFDFSASGASLVGGGIILAVASGVVYLVDRNEYSSTLLIAGAALAAAGYFIGKNSGKGMTIGKKYKLVYVNASDIKR